jgi:uncharacterized protein (DUF885 family)
LTDAVARSFASLTSDNRPAPRTTFEHALHRLLDDLFAAYPVWATGIGFHAYDDRWPDMTEQGRESRLAMLRHHRARLEALDERDLSADERIDRGICLDAIAKLEFEAAELREPAWDPLSWVSLAGNGLFGLLAREFAPWAHRGAALAGRITRLPALLGQARDALHGLPGRPVSLLHTDTALAQLSGIDDLIDQALDEAQRRADEDAALLADLQAAADTARPAIDAFRQLLSDKVRPHAAAEGRLGEALFAAKLRHTLGSEMTPAEVEVKAEQEYARVRSAMAGLARRMWPDWLGDAPLPDSDDDVIRAVLEPIAQQHRRPDELLSWSQAEVARIEEFCRRNEIIGLADEPLEVTWTPVFMRAYGRAFLDSPGPLDKGQRSYYWITPPDESAGPEAVEGYLREDNDRMLTLTAIHEGVPGHYLQLSWANRCPSLARSVFASGTFIEGWAVYVTQVMLDLGLDEDDAALRLTNLKYYLRAVTNALMDVRIHTQGMTEDEAMALMVEGGFQEEDEARAKWLRARLTSTQLSTYFVGSVELVELEQEVRRRQGDAFDYRRHLESVISHGTPPIRWLRRILLADGESREAARA